MARLRKDGQPVQHGNRYTAKVVERERVNRVLAFKPKIAIATALFRDMEERGMTVTQWLDMAVEQFLFTEYTNTEAGNSLEKQPVSPVVEDAIWIAIAQKQAALRTEKKNKHPDQARIEKWEREINELESLLN